jgi:FMN phosphatase YigB (HAD superfamily)
LKKYLLFDWTGTLADEYSLDKTLCNKIENEIAEKERIPFKEAQEKYLDFLRANEDSWIWYDYPYHGKLFGIDWKIAHDLSIDQIKIIPGVKNVLSKYQRNGFGIFLLTNAVKEVITPRIEYLKMSEFFDCIITSDMVKAPKACGKHLQLALKEIGDPANCFSIGDDLEQDIVPAKRLGIRTIQCKYGKTAYVHAKDYQAKLLVSQPDFIIHEFADLLSIVPLE